MFDIYYLIFILSVFTFCFGIACCNPNNIYFKTFILSIFVITVAFSSLRSLSVGTDTLNYLHIFNSVQSATLVLYTKTVESSFYLLMVLVKSFGGDFSILLLLSSSLIIYLYFKTIMNMSNNISLSIFVFVAIFYLFHFNGLRQAIAMSIVFFTFHYIARNKKYSSFFFILVAATFHKSALIFIPIIPLLSYKGKYRNYIIVIFSLLVTLCATSLIEVAADFDARYEHYTVESAGGGGGTTLFFLILGLFLFLFRKKAVSEFRFYDELLTIYFVGAFISIASVLLSLDPSGPLRLNQYFLQAAVLMVPMVVGSFSDIRTRYFLTLFIVAFTGVYFLAFSSNLANLSPYRLNESLF
ncbi:EpsG family protein [Vibrio breoganii]